MDRGPSGPVLSGRIARTVRLSPSPQGLALARTVRPQNTRCRTARSRYAPLRRRTPPCSALRHPTNRTVRLLSCHPRHLYSLLLSLTQKIVLIYITVRAREPDIVRHLRESAFNGPACRRRLSPPEARARIRGGTDGSAAWRARPISVGGAPEPPSRWICLHEETATVRQVIRLRAPIERIYDVVLDDGGAGLFRRGDPPIGVTNLPQDRSDRRHRRTAWTREARGPGDSVAPILKPAATQLACGAGVITSAPWLVDQAHVPRIMGRPAESSARRYTACPDARRRQVSRPAAAPCLR
jgi:hypothetical protein